jgi:hypothetical protein
MAPKVIEKRGLRPYLTIEYRSALSTCQRGALLSAPVPSHKPQFHSATTGRITSPRHGVRTQWNYGNW